MWLKPMASAAWAKSRTAAGSLPISVVGKVAPSFMAAILADAATARRREPATGQGLGRGRVGPVADDDARLRELANLLFAAARNGDVALLTEAMDGGAPPDLT